MVAVNTTSILFQSIFTILNITVEQESPTTSYNYYYLNIGKNISDTKCFGSYGCFALSPPWTSEHRPVSLFPESIAKVEPRLTYYSRENPINGTQFDLDSHDVIKNSGINPILPTYVVTHGYMEGGDKDWIRAMTAELLAKEKSNVIIIDWRGGSSPPYTQAVANIRLVGAISAHLLGDLALYTGHHGLDHVHCIGHSLGAHLCGYIGYTLQKDFEITLGRISGMDPAEPHFAKAGPPVRLDKSAAKFVDVIHTDASQFIRGGLGITESIGHVDYYPNGGTDQPGCDKTIVQHALETGGSFVGGLRKFLGCNHIRSHELYLESINPKCPYMTISCKNYDDFKEGKCFKCNMRGMHCVKFGYHGIEDYQNLMHQRKIGRNQGIVQYVMTGSGKPFCRAHYKTTVHISDSPESKTHGGEIGQLFFMMHNTTDRKGYKTSHAAFNSGGYHEPGQIYTTVIPAEAVNRLKAIEVEWRYDSSIINPLTWRLLSKPKIHVAKVEMESLETGDGIVVCTKDDKPLVSGVPQLMLPSYCP